MGPHPDLKQVRLNNLTEVTGVTQWCTRVQNQELKLQSIIKTLAVKFKNTF